MWLVYFSGSLALMCNVLASLGNFSQIRHNAHRLSVDGLSLSELESRVWGKLPWILYVFCLNQVDYAIFVGDIIGLSFAIALLLQFTNYIRPVSQEVFLRTGFQLCLVFGVFIVAFSAPEILRAQRGLFEILPIAISISALMFGNISQLLETRKRQDASALCPKRYQAFVACNALWIIYALVKGCYLGFSESRTMLVCAIIGLTTNGLVLHQLKYVKSQRVVAVPGSLQPAPAFAASAIS